jgi:hypothetical protein
MRESLYFWIEYVSPFFGLFSFAYTIYQISVNRKKLKQYRQAILDSNKLQSEKLDTLIMKQYQTLQELEKQRKIHL